jgi:2-amino-4-hydroxy-6-hydroxymethyldihydropteridine diphosphokinase
MTQHVFIGLGSNLGDRENYLRQAISSLAPEVVFLRASQIYETPPWGYTDQPAFLNQIVEARTDLEPQALLSKLKKIEKDLGRVERFRNGPRCIDMDILFYDDMVYTSETLTIPHPRIAERGFVLVPLNEIAPDLIHPVLKQKISALLEKADKEGIILFKGIE